jgi:hypothetical protein
MTHEYHATVEWQRQGVAFVDNRYSRGHVWRFDGGVEVPASSAPSNVPLPYSVTARTSSPQCWHSYWLTVVPGS